MTQMLRLIKIAIALLIAFPSLNLAEPSLAFPLPRADNLNPTALISADTPTLPQNYLGIVSLGNCSGSLVRFQDSSPDDAALVLTNGHCVSLLDPGEVRYNEKVNSKIFYLLGESGKTIKTVRSNRLLYATMTQTDIALYELELTYNDLMKENIPTFVLADQAPQIGQAIEIRSGYWRRSFSCAIEAIIPELRESHWVMNDSIRYTKDGCILYGGTSGSPIIDRDTLQIIGIHNTGNENGRECTLNNPCEVDESGNISYEKDRNYGQQTFWLYSCRNEDGGLDFEQSDCHLPRPSR